MTIFNKSFRLFKIKMLVTNLVKEKRKASNAFEINAT